MQSTHILFNDEFYNHMKQNVTNIPQKVTFITNDPFPNISETGSIDCQDLIHFRLGITLDNNDQLSSEEFPDQSYQQYSGPLCIHDDIVGIDVPLIAHLRLFQANIRASAYIRWSSLSVDKCHRLQSWLKMRHNISKLLNHEMESKIKSGVFREDDQIVIERTQLNEKLKLDTEQNMLHGTDWKQNQNSHLSLTFSSNQIDLFDRHLKVLYSMGRTSNRFTYLSSDLSANNYQVMISEIFEMLSYNQFSRSLKSRQVYSPTWFVEPKNAHIQIKSTAVAMLTMMLLLHFRTYEEITSQSQLAEHLKDIDKSSFITICLKRIFNALIPWKCYFPNNIDHHQVCISMGRTLSAIPFLFWCNVRKRIFNPIKLDCAVETWIDSKVPYDIDNESPLIDIHNSTNSADARRYDYGWEVDFCWHPSFLHQFLTNVPTDETMQIPCLCENNHVEVCLQTNQEDCEKMFTDIDESSVSDENEEFEDSFSPLRKKR